MCCSVTEYVVEILRPTSSSLQMLELKDQFDVAKETIRLSKVIIMKLISKQLFYIEDEYGAVLR